MKVFSEVPLGVRGQSGFFGDEFEIEAFQEFLSRVASSEIEEQFSEFLEKRRGSFLTEELICEVLVEVNLLEALAKEPIGKDDQQGSLQAVRREAHRPQQGKVQGPRARNKILEGSGSFKETPSEIKNGFSRHFLVACSVRQLDLALDAPNFARIQVQNHRVIL